MRRSALFGAAGVLVPSAVLTGSVPGVVPAGAPPAGPPAADLAGPARLVDGGALRLPYSTIVGYDRDADVIVGQSADYRVVAAMSGRDGRERWRRDLRTGDRSATVLWSQPELAGGTVLLNGTTRGSGEGALVALDTRTGDVRWRATLAAQAEATAAGPAVLVTTPPETGAAPPSNRSAREAATSSRRARRTTDRHSPATTDRSAATDPSTGANAATADPAGGGRVTALSTATGNLLWEAALPEGCAAGGVAGDRVSVAVELRCGERNELEVRAAGSGRVLARTGLGPGDGFAPIVRDGVTVLRDARSFQVFGRDGRRLADRPGEVCAERCDAAVRDGVVVVAHDGKRDDPDDAAIEGIGLGDGRVRWRANVAAAHLVTAGGRLYAVGPAPRPVPFLVVHGIDAERGPGAGLASEVPYRKGAATGLGDRVLVTGAAGARWYTIVPQPSPPAEPPWPDACRALDPADLGAVFRKEDPDVVDVTVPGAPAHAECRFDVARGPAVTVSVLWAGADARRRFSALEPGPEEVRGRGGTVTTVRFLDGDRIVQVETTGGETTARKVARMIQEHGA
ncbi:PQQ-binding-like beta-propeller repeat protein [Dactylosporangium sucinum]|uniref:outer membrane protein assembly factor BamB family protein n=1 Tax=Dactylosporangium sucinum TaxID=1424081 RepID=UPI00167E5328|nr:PQQ-binding-like beta-propeller repeat protein [Dactylosporangium sucinum]